MAKDKELVPMCWKCPNKITTPIEPGASEFAGCEKNKDIKTYEDAKKHCPDLPEMLANRNKSEKE